MKCKNCGSMIDEKSMFCKNCGQIVMESNKENSNNDEEKLDNQQSEKNYGECTFSFILYLCGCIIIVFAVIFLLSSLTTSNYDGVYVFLVFTSSLLGSILFFAIGYMLQKVVDIHNFLRKKSN
ncbi:MAG: zinc-ribbon domain-containing protein [Clostridiales bacterium]|nr:zinc-ribbon domain-containing protein [Clostridiales bacterium]